MSIKCPICNKLVDVVIVEKPENVTVNKYSCGHKLIQKFLEENVGVKDSLRNKLKDQKGKVLVELKVNEQTEKKILQKDV